MSKPNVISWLMEGDVSIQYQTQRDLLGNDDINLREKIKTEGWGSQFMDVRNDKGFWGQDYYQPKWISTHYTLLDLKNIGIEPHQTDIRKIVDSILKNEKAPDGGILPIGLLKKCDVCVNGMALNFLSYFGANEEELHSVVDFILSEKMGDGGFNCHSNRKGAVHSSLHTTISVLDGFYEFLKYDDQYRVNDIQKAIADSVEFLLMHHLYKSDKTGHIIKDDFLKLYYPTRWYYDILRALDFFQYANIPYDARMDDALDILWSKKTVDGLWKVASPHPGKVHFIMEKAGHASRWNTLRALRVLKKFRPDEVVY